MPKQPHIVIFNPDQWRGDVMGHLGNSAVHTPNLDSLVEMDAVSFSNAYCQNPVCTPSRCSFMTGWYPHTRGHRTMFHMLRPDEPMLLRTLKERGYYVWWGGKNDVVPAQNGYEDYCDVKYQAPNTPERPLRANFHRADDWRGEPNGDNYYSFYVGKVDNPTSDPFAYDNDLAMVEGAVELIRNPPDDRPLCIYLPLHDPHPPYVVEDPWHISIDPKAIPDRIPAPDSWEGFPSLMAGIHKDQGLQDWTEDRWRELRRTYYGMCYRMDGLFGMVVDALHETHTFDDTAIFFFSDHGDYTGDYGLVEKTQNTFQDCLTRVPFVIKPPKDVPVKPRVTDALVELIDFPATVEAILDYEPGHWHFGKSLLPVLAGETEEHRDAVFCEGGRLAYEEQAKEKESRAEPGFLYWPRLKYQLADGPEHTKATMIRTQRYKYVHRLYESDELYDLESDPAEVNNRIDDPDMDSVRQEMVSRLMQFYLETGDAVPLETDKRN